MCVNGHTIPSVMDEPKPEVYFFKVNIVYIHGYRCMYVEYIRT